MAFRGFCIWTLHRSCFIPYSSITEVTMWCSPSLYSLFSLCHFHTCCIYNDKTGKKKHTFIFISVKEFFFKHHIMLFLYIADISKCMHFELILILLSAWNYKMDCCWKSKSFFYKHLNENSLWEIVDFSDAVFCSQFFTFVSLDIFIASYVELFGNRLILPLPQS